MKSIKEIRTELGFTQAEFAELLGLGNRVRVTEYENGRMPAFHVRLIIYFLDKKIISVDQLKSAVNFLRKSNDLRRS